MRKFFKPILSALVVGIFLLMAWATSYEDDFVSPDFFSVVVNTSDSCSILNLALLHKARRESFLLDSLVFPITILRQDSAFIEFDSLDYKTLRYTCLCPSGASTLREVDISTADWFRMEAGCD